MKALYEFANLETGIVVYPEYREYARRYYAGRAMQGILATPHDNGEEFTPQHIAELAVEMADALITELDK